MATIFLQAMGLSLGLIVAIGAQNAFVLRQGLRGEFVVEVVLLCMLADAALITAGVLGMAQLINGLPYLETALTLLGIGFLTVYGWQAVRAAIDKHALTTQAVGGRGSRRTILAQAVGFTLLNPHVYLDTLLLVGGIGAQYPTAQQWWFIAGACTGSVAWFSALGFGARALAPVFARPVAWRVLDALVALMMFSLAFMLLLKLLTA